MTATHKQASTQELGGVASGTSWWDPQSETQGRGASSTSVASVLGQTLETKVGTIYPQC